MMDASAIPWELLALCIMLFIIMIVPLVRR